MIPWGGALGLILAAIITGKKQKKIYILSIVLAWVFYLIGLYMNPYELYIRHGLSFVGSIIPFYIYRGE